MSVNAGQANLSVSGPIQAITRRDYIRSLLLTWGNGHIYDRLQGYQIITIHAPYRGSPIPQGAPLLGNIHQLHVKNLHLVIEQWQEMLGPIFAFDVGPRRIVVTSDPELSQQVLRNRPKSFRKYKAMTSVIDEMGFAGVFSAEGGRWRPQRALIM